MTVFKIIASKGGRVVFDERVEANTPREARRKMKERLGIETLSGIVYAITEIPLYLIKQIVAEEIAAATVRREGGNEIDVAALVQSAVSSATSTAIGKIERKIDVIAMPAPSSIRRDPLANMTGVPEFLANEGAGIPTLAIVGPNWKVIKRDYLQRRSPKQTAAKFNIPVNTLKARVRREGWGK
jgi:hypothetical protein